MISLLSLNGGKFFHHQAVTMPSFILANFCVQDECGRLVLAKYSRGRIEMRRTYFGLVHVAWQLTTYGSNSSIVHLAHLTSLTNTTILLPTMSATHQGIGSAHRL